jgi:hypothetical protein
VFADGTGYFLFDNLLPGDYRLRFTPPPGYAFTSKGSGGAEHDSNTNPNGVTDTFSVEPVVTGDTVDELTDPIRALKVNPTVGAGLVPVVAVGDYVWFDDNVNGVQDAGEQGVPGVSVEIFNPDGTPAIGADGLPVPAVLTDLNGRYLIDNLLPGDYYVVFTRPVFGQFTGADTGADNRDSDADVVTGRTAVFTISNFSAGNTTVDTDPSTRARFINGTIDAGIIVPKLPDTGGLAERLLCLVLLPVLLGLAMIVVTRRRRRPAHSH